MSEIIKVKGSFAPKGLSQWDKIERCLPEDFYERFPATVKRQQKSKKKSVKNVTKKKSSNKPVKVQTTNKKIKIKKERGFYQCKNVVQGGYDPSKFQASTILKSLSK